MLAGYSRALRGKAARQAGRPDVVIKSHTSVQAAQLNTIRRAVIWLDPRSRERDLLAAVVDR